MPSASPTSCPAARRATAPANSSGAPTAITLRRVILWPDAPGLNAGACFVYVHAGERAAAPRGDATRAVRHQSVGGWLGPREVLLERRADRAVVSPPSL